MSQCTYNFVEIKFEGVNYFISKTHFINRIKKLIRSRIVTPLYKSTIQSYKQSLCAAVQFDVSFGDIVTDQC